MMTISRETFDAHLKGMLDSAASNQLLKGLWANYQIAKTRLPKEVLAWIAKIEPELSDHGILHIENVLENVARLLDLDPTYNHESPSNKKPFENVEITQVESYLLAMALLFHDAGNVIARKRHADTGKKVVVDVMNGVLKPEEIRLVDKVMAAHSGESKSGDGDKISDLPISPEYMHKEPVRLRPLAALVRFADELAEGPQRTSNFLRDNEAFKIGSGHDAKRNPFHDYASVTRINIDRGHGRVAVQYEIDLDDKMFAENGKARLRSLLIMIFHRIHKSDDERRYARFYGGVWLAPFQTTEAVIRFYRHGIEVDHKLPALVIDDLVIPGAHLPGETDQIWIKRINNTYDADEITEKVWA